MAKKYYYDGKLYNAKDWDIEKKRPLDKKVVELKPVKEVEEATVEDPATPDEAA